MLVLLPVKSKLRPHVGILNRNYGVEATFTDMSFKARFSMFSKVEFPFKNKPENELFENITSSNLPCVKAGHVYTFPP
jgi:hypothetical protein